MNKQAIRTSLDELRAELARTGDADQVLRQRLDPIIGRLEDYLESSDDEEHRDSLTSNLQKTIEHFEAEHPRTTGILNRIMVTLGNIGI